VEFFSLEIKVEGLCTTNSLGTKSYSKGTIIKWNVEIGIFTFELLMNSLRNKVKWAPNQDATVWFFDKRIGEDVRLTNEIKMLDLYEFIPDSHDRTQPTVAQHTPKTGDGASASKGANSKGPTTMEADVPEPDRDPNLFDNDEEYAGVDDEHLYMAGPSTQPSDNAQPDDGSTDPFADIGGIPHDAEVNDQDPQELHVLHDLENPNIAKGSQFPNIIAFRKAIRHYAVSVGFEFARLKIDKTRFIRGQDGFTRLVLDRLCDWLKKNPKKTTKDAKEKLDKDFGIKLKYSKAWSD
uniref:Uncharacterized protein n=1 Tax=Setaria italica TaxID=4555 RepID=K3ZMA5_SETIT